MGSTFIVSGSVIQRLFCAVSTAKKFLFDKMRYFQINRIEFFLLIEKLSNLFFTSTKILVQ